jgi:hypothetical protein
MGSYTTGVLGCVVFHALTGQPPYPGDDLITTLMSHVSDPLPLTGNPGWDGFFATVLAKDPADRFDSGAAVIEGLATLQSAAAGDLTDRVSAVAPPVVSLNDPRNAYESPLRRLLPWLRLLSPACLSTEAAAPSCYRPHPGDR